MNITDRYKNKIINHGFYGTITVEPGDDHDCGVSLHNCEKQGYVWAPYIVSFILPATLDSIDDQLTTLDGLTTRWKSLAAMTLDQLMNIKTTRL